MTIICSGLPSANVSPMTTTNARRKATLPPTNGTPTPTKKEIHLEQRSTEADLRDLDADRRDARADEREQELDLRQLAANAQDRRVDRREANADERDRLADERDRLADLREHAADGGNGRLTPATRPPTNARSIVSCATGMSTTTSRRGAKGISSHVSNRRGTVVLGEIGETILRSLPSATRPNRRKPMP